VYYGVLRAWYPDLRILTPLPAPAFAQPRQRR
jgi:hypothetical protein